PPRRARPGNRNPNGRRPTQTGLDPGRGLRISAAPRWATRLAPNLSPAARRLPQEYGSRPALQRARTEAGGHGRRQCHRRHVIRAGREGAARRPALLSALSGSRDRARRKPRRSSRPARGAGPARRQALRRRDARSESPRGWQAPAGRRGGPPVARYHSVRNITFAILLLAARLEPLLHSVKRGEYAESSEC